MCPGTRSNVAAATLKLDLLGCLVLVDESFVLLNGKPPGKVLLVEPHEPSLALVTALLRCAHLLARVTARAVARVALLCGLSHDAAANENRLQERPESEHLHAFLRHERLP